MALFIRGEQKIHFVHIPKTAGRSIVDLLESNGWHYVSPPPQLWSSNKMEGHPQIHIWEKWEEAKNVDFRFSLVRNPYSRIKSLIKMWIQHDFWDSPAKEIEKLAEKNPLTKEDIEKAKLFYHRGSAHLIDKQTGEFLSVFDVSDKEFYESVTEPQDYSLGVVECDELSQKNIKNSEIHLRHNFISSVLKDFHGIDLFEGNVEKMVEFYFSSELSKTFGDGLNPTPMHCFVSEEVKIYKIENEMSVLLRDLKSAGFIDENAEIAKINENTLYFDWKPFEWSENSPTQKLFSILYARDFDTFGYSKKLPCEEKL